MKELTTAKDAVPVEASAGVPNAREAAKLKPNRFEKLYDKPRNRRKKRRTKCLREVQRDRHLCAMRRDRRLV